MNNPDKDLNFNDLFVPLSSVKCICFIALIGILVFFTSLFNGFVADDHAQVVDNERIHSIENIGSFFVQNRLEQSSKSALGSTYYKPVLDSSFALIYAIFGPSPFGFHFVQISLYIINSCLVFLLFKYFFRLEISFGLTLIYLVHPINHESAMYISALQETLFTFFGLTGLLLVGKKAFSWQIFLAFILLLLALYSKETGLLYLMITLLFIYMYKVNNFVRFVIGEFIIFGIYLFSRFHAIGFFEHGLTNAPIQQLGLAERVLNIPAIFIFYIKSVLFPIYISSSYQWIIKTMDFNNFFLPILMMILFIGALIYLGEYLKKNNGQKYKILIFFSAWLVIGVLFHLQILPLDQTVAERWFYFPMIGFLGVMGVLWESFGNKKKKLLLYVLIILILLLSLRTLIRGLDFKDDFTLVSHDIEVSPESYNLQYMISREYYGRNQLDLAQTHAEKSVELFPYITNYTNLGAIYSKKGNYAKAKENYLKALEYGDDRLPYENLASLSLVYGDMNESIEYIKKNALAKYPDDGRIWVQLSLLEYMNGDEESAKRDILRAEMLSNDPMVTFAKSLIASQKKLEIKADNGDLRFLLKD